MFDLPEIKRKKPKPAYKKPEAVKELERLAFLARLDRFPNHPREMMTPVKFRDDTANALTSCITTYFRLKGAFSSRLNNTGIYDKRLNRFRPGTSRKGLPDVLATYQGKSLFIEVKTGSDRMSEHQEKVKAEQEASGGLYFLAYDFTEFKAWFDSL
jgi:hypothetical protein